MVKKKRAKKAVPKIVPMPVAAAPAPSGPSMLHPSAWVPLLFFAFATWFFFKQSFVLVWGLLAAEAVWRMFSTRAYSGPADVDLKPAVRPGTLVSLLACFSMLALAAGVLTSYRWIFPKFPAIDPLHIQWILFYLVIRLAFAFRALPPLEKVPDLSPYYSRILLLLLLAGAAWIRLHRLGDLPGTYWDDCAEDIFNIRNKVEFHDYRFILDLGTEEPFFQYVGGMMAYFFQDTPSFILHKMTLILVGMVSLWVFYLLGKEIGGRRVGLVMVGLGPSANPSL